MTRLAAIAIAVVALVFAPSASAMHWLDDAPGHTITVPGDLGPVEATGPLTAVSYSVGVTPADEGVSCDAGSPFPVGTTHVTCTADDADPASFNVTVTDHTPPDLTVPGDVSVNATGPSTPVSFSASASDLVDGGVGVSCSPASGSGFAVGTTPVTCHAADSHGNAAPDGHFNVSVHDADGPVITAPGDITAAATGPSGAAVHYDASATDAVAGAVAVVCAPASDSLFPLGSTAVVCHASDGSNSSQAQFQVTVTDQHAPVVTVPGNLTVPADSSGGGHPTFSASATDDVAGPLAASCSPASGSLFAFGDTTVTCSANDGTNTGSAQFHVNVVDTTAPVITPPADIGGVEATGPGGAAVAYGPVNATDAVDGTIGATCAPASGATFALGTTTVTCNARDAHGNSATQKTFKVTVVDHTAPRITDPPDLVAEATGPAGAAVPYGTVSATDAVDGTIGATCAPASNSTFALGSTTVTCNATDAHGNRATAQTFTVTVRDTTAPSFTGVPSQLTVEANGPGGSKVSFSLGAVDLVDGPLALVGCTPSPGSQFALGATPVSCHATDAHGNTGTALFQVSVLDRTPPSLAIPGPTNVYATTPQGIPETAPAFFAFRHAASAADIVDPHPRISDNLGSFAEIGTHDVGFVARDASGNVTVRSTSFTVLPAPPAGTTPLPPAPPATLPADVQGLQLFTGSGFVRLVWGAVSGATQYLVYRSESAGSRRLADAHGELVYKGAATTYTDRGLKNGVEYRYVVVSQDAAGNQSAGVAAAATPRLNLLRTPKDGARLKKPPKLVWTRNAEAAYYNVQLFRGEAKILSSWPLGASFQLKRTWKYQGRRYTLTKGVYRWYVWPGFGARSAVDYGELLGSNSFQMTR